MTHALGRRSGFAMVTAIFLLSLVAMTLTALSAGLFLEFQRTRILKEDAQLRQLLLAGAAFAQTHLDATDTVSVHLPDALKDQSAALEVQIRPGNSSAEKIAEIEASLPRHQLSQQLRFSRQGDVWRVIEARLGD